MLALKIRFKFFKPDVAIENKTFIFKPKCLVLGIENIACWFE